MFVNRPGLGSLHPILAFLSARHLRTKVPDSRWVVGKPTTAQRFNTHPSTLSLEVNILVLSISSGVRGGSSSAISDQLNLLRLGEVSPRTFKCQSLR